MWSFFGYLRCTDSLSELESIGRSNLTWPASPATDLGRTVLEYAEQNQESLALISLDNEKAFDRMEQNFVHKVLEKYKFHKMVQIII